MSLWLAVYDCFIHWNKEIKWLTDPVEQRKHCKNLIDIGIDIWWILFLQLRQVLTVPPTSLPTAASLSAWSPRSPSEVCTSNPLDTRYKWVRKSFIILLNYITCIIHIFPIDRLVLALWIKCTSGSLSRCVAPPLSSCLFLFKVFHDCDIVSRVRSVQMFRFSKSYNAKM